jgi:hypothetical protein
MWKSYKTHNGCVENRSLCWCDSRWHTWAFKDWLLIEICTWQVVSVCIIVACAATLNAYPGYYGHGGHDYIPAGVEEDQHVSIAEKVQAKKSQSSEVTASKCCL